MRVLWITNSPFPEAAKELGVKAPIGVGWIHSAANALVSFYEDVDLTVASIYNGKHIKHFIKNRINYCMVPSIVKTSGDKNRIKTIWLQINKQYKPNIIHIQGAEYAHSYSYVKACGSNNVVVSIQGMLSVIEKYYFGGIKKTDLLKSISLRDIVRFDTIFGQHKKILSRGKTEQLLIKNINHVIGRTFWDRSHVWVINPNAKYHFCNETIRPLFYKRSWSLQHCERYSIFVSQAHYPLKGFHQLLNALSIVVKHYPKTKVYVAGNNFFSGKGIRISGFGRYINSCIKKNNLTKHVVFTGFLGEQTMCERFVNSHLFVNASSIENSPNSVGEAQLLGVPCIASDVGGTSDMIDHEKTGLLYRFEEFEMLAAYICELFSNDKLSMKISENARICAAERHNKQKNASALYQIYSEIIN